MSTLELRQRLVFALSGPDTGADIRGLKKKLIAKYTTVVPTNPSRVGGANARAGSAPLYTWLKRQL